MALSNKNRFHKPFKETKSRGVVSIDCIKRDELRDCKSNFTLSRLNQCKKIFTDYLDKNGEQAPMHTNFSWFNDAINYTLSFTHYIATNQEYAVEVLRYIRDAKLNAVDCDLLLSFTRPVKEELKNFHIQQDSAYVRVSNPDGEELYYINKPREICIELKFPEEKLWIFQNNHQKKIKLFDLQLKPSTQIKPLSNAELKQINAITGHCHIKQEHIAVFYALSLIKKIHSTMESRRIFGRVRSGIEETLTKFNLPLKECEFQKIESHLNELFKLSKESDEKERIFSPSFMPY